MKSSLRRGAEGRGGSNRENENWYLRELLLHRGDDVPCVRAHAGCSRSRRGSMHLQTVILCSAQRPVMIPDKGRARPGNRRERRTHLDGLARLRRSRLGGLGLGLGFHIAGRSGSDRLRLKRGERSRCVYVWREVGVMREETDSGLMGFILFPNRHGQMRGHLVRSERDVSLV